MKMVHHNCPCGFKVLVFGSVARPCPGCGRKYCLPKMSNKPTEVEE